MHGGGGGGGSREEGGGRACNYLPHAGLGGCIPVMVQVGVRCGEGVEVRGEVVGGNRPAARSAPAHRAGVGRECEG